MERFGHIIVCCSCDFKICDDSISCKITRNGASVSRVLDGIKTSGKSKKQTVLCSCGETIGVYQPSNKVLKYSLDLDKVRRCTLRTSEQHKPQPLKKSVSPPILNKEDSHSDKKKLPSLTTEGEEKTDSEVKKTVQYLQEKIKAMEISQQEKINAMEISLQEKIKAMEISQQEKIKELENNYNKKLKDIVHTLFSNKMDIMRILEVVMALHSSVNLAPVFDESVSDINVSALVCSSLHDSD